MKQSNVPGGLRGNIHARRKIYGVDGASGDVSRVVTELNAGVIDAVSSELTTEDAKIRINAVVAVGRVTDMDVPFVKGQTVPLSRDTVAGPAAEVTSVELQLEQKNTPTAQVIVGTELHTLSKSGGWAIDDVPGEPGQRNVAPGNMPLVVLFDQVRVLSFSLCTPHGPPFGVFVDTKHEDP